MGPRSSVQISVHWCCEETVAFSWRYLLEAFLAGPGNEPDLPDAEMLRRRGRWLSSRVMEIYLQEVMISRSVPDGDLKHRLLVSIPELDAAFGPHILFEQADERDRAESSCLSTLALVGGRYEAFTKPQAPKELLLASQWDELEAIVRWIDPTPNQVHGALVLLSIRALAKSKMVIRQVPLDSKLPERTLLYLIEHERCVVPSVSFLSDDALNFVKNALEIHEQFNLAQMLQGENVPGSVMGLQLDLLVNSTMVEQVAPMNAPNRQDMIHDKGEEPITGGFSWHRFMTRKNAETTIAGIRMLQQLMKGTPALGFSVEAQARPLHKKSPATVPPPALQAPCTSHPQRTLQGSRAVLVGAAVATALAEVLQRRSKLSQASYQLHSSRRPIRAFRATSPVNGSDELDTNGDESSIGLKSLQRDRDAMQSETSSSMDVVLEDKLEAFKGYLIFSEETGPLPYRVTASFFVALGTLCFVTRVVSPNLASTLFLQQVEDIVNVSFFVKFLLLFWVNEFNISWLFTGKGVLDLASSLPVLCLPARLIGGPALEKTTD
ncbi:unnamed protein product [Symbiodinium microadriaticum]|nr:unnamed protein product [Symbiodinium microadriaticum]